LWNRQKTRGCTSYHDFGAFLRHFAFWTIIDNFSTFFRRYVQPRKYFKKVENLRIYDPVFDSEKTKKKFFFWKVHFSKVFDWLFHFNNFTRKLYFFSLIFLASKKSQKSGSTCPWELIYWTCIMEFLVLNQKSNCWRGFEPFFHFDVKTKKLYFFSLILLASKKSQKNGSTCPWELIYWTWIMEFLVFYQKTNGLRGFEPFSHFDVNKKSCIFSRWYFSTQKHLKKVDQHVRESRFIDYVQWESVLFLENFLQKKRIVSKKRETSFWANFPADEKNNILYDL